MGLKYTGDGAFLPGIPARDLTDEEEQALTPEQREAIEAAGIYAKTTEVEAPKPKAKSEGDN